MGGLSGLASLGFFAGGAARGYETAQEQRRKEDEHQYQMEERARDRDMAARIAAASGANPEQFTQGDTTFGGMSGGLDSQDIPREATTGFRLGGQEQATPFTPEQVQGHRSQMITDALQSRGTIQSLAAADALRTNAQARKLGGLQINKAERTEAEENHSKFLLDHMRSISGSSTPEELESVANSMADHNKGIKNGFAMSRVSEVGGQKTITLMDEKTGKMQAVPLTYDNLMKGLEFQFNHVSREAFEKAKTHKQKEVELGLKEREVGVKEKDQTSKAGVDQAHITYYDRAGRAAIMNAQNKGENKPSWQIVGTDSDGEAIQHDKTTGNFKRRDGGKIQDVDFFKKITGAAATGGDPVRDAMIKGVATGNYRPEDIVAYDADKAKRTRISGAANGGYTPSARPGPAGAAQQGLPVEPEGPQLARNPGESMAAFSQRRLAALRAAAAERDRLRIEQYGVQGAEEEAGYLSRGIDPRRPAQMMP